MGVRIGPLCETFESERFPGWKIHVREDMLTTDILMVAIRKSDGKRLEYSEPIPWRGDWREAVKRLKDRLGEDFLELVPLEPPACIRHRRISPPR